jgi:hypothetical protein
VLKTFHHKINFIAINCLKKLGRMNRVKNWLGLNANATATEDAPKPTTSTPIGVTNTIAATLPVPRTSINQNQSNISSDVTTTTTIPQQQPVQVPVNVPVQLPPRTQNDASELLIAVDRVNETKTNYDNCEARRMTAVINGKDAQDYSCEREFAAFKKAFDVQLALESKLPTGSH